MSNEIERTVEKKAGPLPVWAWVAGGAGLLVGVWFIFLRNPGGASGGVLMGGGSAGQGSSGGPSLGVPDPVPAVITNSQWLENAIGQVELALGLPASEVELYLKSYLGGTSPVGSSAANEAYHNVVQSALSLVGAAPQAPQLATTQSNPFSSNTTYLNSLLSFLPNGTSTDMQQEIINLFHGASSSISRAASEALASAQGIIGTPPSAIAFSITEDNAATQALKNTIAELQSALTTAGTNSANSIAALTAAGAVSTNTITNLQGQLAQQTSSSQAALAAQVAAAAATLANVQAGDAAGLAAAKTSLASAQQGQVALQAKVAQADKLWYALTHTSEYDKYGNSTHVKDYLKFIGEWFGITYQ